MWQHFQDAPVIHGQDCGTMGLHNMSAGNGLYWIDTLKIGHADSGKVLSGLGVRAGGNKTFSTPGLSKGGLGGTQVLDRSRSARHCPNCPSSGQLLLSRNRSRSDLHFAISEFHLRHAVSHIVNVPDTMLQACPTLLSMNIFNAE